MNESIHEAQQRLYTAQHGFAALMTLLSTDGVQVASEDIRCLIQPLVGDVDAAVDELDNIPQ